MTMPRASFVSALFFVAAVAGGCWILEELATGLGVAVAHADTAPIDAAAPAPDAAGSGATAGSAAGSGSAAPAVGSGSSAIGSASSTTVSTTTTITNADQLHDVLSDPLSAYQDVKSLASVKLSLAALAALIMLTRIVARLPGKVGAWFRVGVRATIVAGVGTVGIAVFNLATTGATLISLAMVAFVAIVALLNPVPAGPPTSGTKAA